MNIFNVIEKSYLMSLLNRVQKRIFNRDDNNKDMEYNTSCANLDTQCLWDNASLFINIGSVFMCSDRLNRGLLESLMEWDLYGPTVKVIVCLFITSNRVFFFNVFVLWRLVPLQKCFM